MKSPVTTLTPELAAKLRKAPPPCLSLYQPTHRHFPDNQQDPIRFRNLLKQLHRSLQQRYSEPECQKMLEPLEDLAADTPFWNHTLDGLAVFVATGHFHLFQLQRPVQELALVADSFHLKPLRRLSQTGRRFQILGLTRQSLRLFEGDRDVLDEIIPATGVPRTLTEALGHETTEPHLTVAAYGGAGNVPMHHGHGGRSDESDLDAERFFRAADRAVLEHHSRPSGLPLILAALAQHHALFHRISQNPALLPEAIPVNPDAVSTDELRAHAWDLFAPKYHERIDALRDQFSLGRAKGQAADSLEEVASAVAAGRVSHLLLEADRHLPGRLHSQTGHVEPDDLSNPVIDDVLDDLGELASQRGSDVLVIPAELMPTRTGVAAIYRY